MDPLSILHGLIVWIVPTEWSALWTVVIVVLPFLVTRLVFALVDLVSARQFFQVPLVYGLSALFGVCVGLAMIHVREEIGRELTLGAVFVRGGGWDIPADAFLTERANPFGYDPVRVIDEFLMPHDGDALQLIVLIGLVCFALVMVLAFVLWTPAAALRSIVSGLIVAIWSALLAVYVVSLAYWSLALLNFWVFAVVLMILQYYRNHPRRA